MFSLWNKNFSIMAATGYVMTNAGVAAVANATGLALLATPWVGAGLTMAAMLVAGHLGGKVSAFVWRKTRQNLEAHCAATGLMVGFGLATVIAPWAAVVGGFSAMMTQRFLLTHPAINRLAKVVVLLTPLAPLSALAFVAKGLGAAAAMVPSSVAALATPTNALIVTGLGSVGVTLKKNINLWNKSLSIMAATGFIMTKAGVAATLANMTGVALLANPWGGAALTMVAMLTAGHAGHAAAHFAWRKAGYSSEAYNATSGLIAGLGLATVTAPWLAVVGGFSAMIAERVLYKNQTIAFYSDYAKQALLLAPLAPAGIAGWAARGAASAAAMVPGAVAAWTPTLALFSTGVGSVGHSLKEVRSIPESVKRWIP